MERWLEFKVRVEAEADEAPHILTALTEGCAAMGFPVEAHQLGVEDPGWQS